MEHREAQGRADLWKVAIWDPQWDGGGSAAKSEESSSKKDRIKGGRLAVALGFLWGFRRHAQSTVKDESGRECV